MFALFDTNSQNSMISFDYSWFLAKNISNFVSLPWKLHNRYCHNKESHQVRAHGTKMVLEQYVKWLDVDNEKSPDVSAIWNFLKWLKLASQWQDQRYTYRVLQTIQMKIILWFIWAKPAILGSTKTALKFKYEILIG